MQNKLIFIVLDGCRYEAAMEQLGYMNHLVEHGKASSYKVQAEMPSNSRPLYEVLMTGVPTDQNGITTNASVRNSKEQSIFALCKEQNKKTAAAAYHWVSELYNEAPFSIFNHRFQEDPEKNIQQGLFYFEDTYPDSHLFADAHALIERSQPDFVLVHSMNIDDAGHKYGGFSKEYFGMVNRVDSVLGLFLPKWVEQGYQVIVTSDHGMDEHGIHGGSLSAHREVPLFVISDKIEAEKRTELIPQLQLAPFACQLLKIPVAEKMVTVTFPKWIQ